MRVPRKTICFGLAIALLLIASGVYWIGSTASEAEHALWATCLVSTVVEEYVSRYGKWPTSWKELESVSVSVGKVYSWPHDAAEIQKYVDVQFDLTLDEVADQDAEGFRAIKPRVPVYGGYQRYFASLLSSVQKARNQGRN